MFGFTFGGDKIDFDKFESSLLRIDFDFIIDFNFIKARIRSF